MSKAAKWKTEILRSVCLCGVSTCVSPRKRPKKRRAYIVESVCGGQGGFVGFGESWAGRGLRGGGVSEQEIRTLLLTGIFWGKGILGTFMYSTLCKFGYYLLPRKLQ